MDGESDDDDRVPDPFPDIGGSPKWKFGLGSAMVRSSVFCPSCSLREIVTESKPL